MIYPTLTDDEVLQQVNECIDQGKVMSLSLMERGLQVQRDLLAQLQSERTQLATGLKRLTARQSEAFDFIKDHIDRHGYSPSVRMIGEAIGNSSSSTTHSIISQLVKKGYITRPSKYTLQIIGKREVGANAVRGHRSGD